MKLSYFEDTDTLYIELLGTPSTESQEVAEGITLDLNDSGQTVGIEIEQASKRVNPVPSRSCSARLPRFPPDSSLPVAESYICLEIFPLR
ncbi:MAG: DUF2283 domain-containing protein [Candidatus Cloacimonetes bacterium]|nr:DUF2283 domain-containing protein [Candidatus Cloacimonadota bacterium]